MKYLKEFESEIGKYPKVDDYVIAHFEPPTSTYISCSTYISWKGEPILLDDYIDINIGKIVKMSGTLNFLIKYSEDSWWFKLNEIVHWSENKEDLELVLQAKRYNL